jgi:hypothetical protein
MKAMRKKFAILAVAGVGTLLAGLFLSMGTHTKAASSDPIKVSLPETSTVADAQRDVYERSPEIEVLVDGRPLEEYAARGRTYVQASEGNEYELRIRNPYPYRVAVALAVDGLNSIDARHTTAWEASKWVVGPYQSITISGWQVSAERARHFYFTTERDSYGAKLGQTANLGVISAVFFRERQPVPVQISPPPRPVRPPYERDDKDGVSDNRSSNAPSASARKESGSIKSYPAPDEESAATGIGRSLNNDVRWVNMQLESHPVSEVTIRYEYYQGLVRLGIMPRPYPRPDPLRRREDARAFEDRRFSPEP